MNNVCCVNCGGDILTGPALCCQCVGDIPRVLHSNHELANELRVANLKLKEREHPGDTKMYDSPEVLKTAGFWPDCGCGECYAIHCLSEAQTENSRLRKVLKQIVEWDCLSPTPRTDLCADFGWLKRLVEEALNKRSLD